MPHTLPVSRRCFISTTAAVASLTTQASLAAPAKPYRTAIIGHTGRGNYGHGLDRVWQDIPHTKVIAVADANETGLAKTRKAMPGVTGYADYREMLRRERPELLTIGPRWLDQHRDMVVAAAKSGVKGIYLEKPMCRSLREADEMVAACEGSGTKLAIATQTRFSPQARIIREMIKAGDLGRIVEYRARGKEDRRGGGEDLWVLGTHTLDLMRHFGGDATTCHAAVYQQGKLVQAADVAQGNEGIGPLAGDEIHASYRLASGVTGFWDSVRNGGGNPHRFGIRILGTQGVIELYDTGSLPLTRYLPSPGWSTGRSGKSWIPVTSQGVGRPETLPKGSLHQGNVMAIRDLIAAIEEGRQPITSIYEARKTVEMIAAVFESHRLQRTVTLPLANRENPLELLRQGRRA